MAEDDNKTGAAVADPTDQDASSSEGGGFHRPALEVVLGRPFDNDKIVDGASVNSIAIDGRPAGSQDNFLPTEARVVITGKSLDEFDAWGFFEEGRPPLQVNRFFERGYFQLSFLVKNHDYNIEAGTPLSIVFYSTKKNLGSWRLPFRFVYGQRPEEKQATDTRQQSLADEEAEAEGQAPAKPRGRLSRLASQVASAVKDVQEAAAVPASTAEVVKEQEETDDVIETQAEEANAPRQAPEQAGSEQADEMNPSEEEVDAVIAQQEEVERAREIQEVQELEAMATAEGGTVTQAQVSGGTSVSGGAEGQVTTTVQPGTVGLQQTGPDTRQAASAVEVTQEVSGAGAATENIQSSVGTRVTTEANIPANAPAGSKQVGQSASMGLDATISASSSVEAKLQATALGAPAQAARSATGSDPASGAKAESRLEASQTVTAPLSAQVGASSKLQAEAKMGVEGGAEGTVSVEAPLSSSAPEVKFQSKVGLEQQPGALGPTAKEILANLKSNGKVTGKAPQVPAPKGAAKPPALGKAGTPPAAAPAGKGVDGIAAPEPEPEPEAEPSEEEQQESKGPPKEGGQTPTDQQPKQEPNEEPNETPVEVPQEVKPQLDKLRANDAAREAGLPLPEEPSSRPESAASPKGKNFDSAAPVLKPSLGSQPPGLVPAARGTGPVSASLPGQSGPFAGGARRPAEGEGGILPDTLVMPEQGGAAPAEAGGGPENEQPEPGGEEAEAGKGDEEAPEEKRGGLLGAATQAATTAGKAEAAALATEAAVAVGAGLMEVAGPILIVLGVIIAIFALVGLIFAGACTYFKDSPAQLDAFGIVSACEAINNSSAGNFVQGQLNLTGPGGFTPSGGGVGNGQCKPVSGKATPENMASVCFSSETAYQAASIAMHESGGNPLIESRVDICRDSSGNPVKVLAGPDAGKVLSVSIGLFQLNLTAHTIGSLNCPKAFNHLYTASNKQCQIVNQTLYDDCVQAAKDATQNIQAACRISQNGTNWNAWANTVKACGF